MPSPHPQHPGRRPSHPASGAVARIRARLARMLCGAWLLIVSGSGPVWAANPPVFSTSVISNLLSIDVDLAVGDPRTRVLGEDGPKGIAVADFNRDGTNDLAAAGTDGSITVYPGLGHGVFGAPLYLHVPTNAGGSLPSLRGLVAADLNGDGRPDLAVAAPFEGVIHVFTNLSTQALPPRFAAAPSIPAWRGVRDLAVADLVGDHRPTLLAAGPNTGLRAFQWRDDGPVLAIPGPPELDYSTRDDSSSFPKPVYSIRALRPDPASALELVAVTHAETNTVWLLRFAPPDHWLILPGITNDSPSHDLDIGPLRGRTNSPVNDLVTVQRDSGTLTLWEGVEPGKGPFQFVSTGPFQTLDVPGGPRSVRIADINQDGWNDLVVVVRNFDTVVTFLNSNGHFYASAERPVGASPRDLVTAPLDQDIYPDVAVMNRGSSSITPLFAADNTAAYRGIDGLYLVDGNVTGLSVEDFDHDGLKDVILLHRSSGDFSVWRSDRSQPGHLLPPQYYTIGGIPAAMLVQDLNGDGNADVVTSNLGTADGRAGFLTVHLGHSDRTFGKALNFPLPPGVEGRLFSLVAADLNGDGTLDLAAGFLDDHLALFRGTGRFDSEAEAGLVFARALPFVSQARGLVAQDFDHDGDQDLAGVGVSGEIWVLENPASRDGLLNPDTRITPRRLKPPAAAGAFGARKILAVDYSGDGTLDLVTGSGTGAWLYEGRPGSLDFRDPVPLTSVGYPVSDVQALDLDGDHQQDLLISCRDADCISLFTRVNGNPLSYDTPASRFIAAADLDGDNVLDLVGCGRVLWVALSRAAPTNTAPLVAHGERPRIPGVVINEIMAYNTSRPLRDSPSGSGGERVVDWVELYNDGPASLSLGRLGWRLRLLSTDLPGITRTQDFRFPPNAFLGSGSHLVLLASSEPRNDYYTGFGLPREGATLQVLDGQDHVVDEETYPPQRPNISYARFRDGLHSFVYNPFPSPGRPNLVNGVLDPSVRFAGVDLDSFRPGAAMRFHCEVSADVGVSSVLMRYAFLDAGNQALSYQQIPLKPDAAQPPGSYITRYSAEVPGGFPEGSDVQFFFEVTDLNDQVIRFPEDPQWGTWDDPGNLLQIGFAPETPSLEISEVLASNRTIAIPDRRGTPDYVEIRNTGPEPVDLQGVSLGLQVAQGSRYVFPVGDILAPGGYRVVLCDGDPSQGPDHAPFRLNSAGDTVVLMGSTTNQSRTLIDWTSFGPQLPDQAIARLGRGGRFVTGLDATPGRANLDRLHAERIASPDAGAVVVLWFSAEPGSRVEIQRTARLDPPAWSALPDPVLGQGFEQRWVGPVGEGGFFRLMHR